MGKIEIDFCDDALIALNELTKAILSLAAAGEATSDDDDDDGDEPASEAKKPAKKAAKKAAKGPSIEKVRSTLKEYAAIEGKTAAIAILNDIGDAASIGELDEDKYQDIIDKCNEGD